MQRPPVTFLILALAAVANGWLFVSKILPTLTPGVAPGYQALYRTGNEPLPIGWSIMLNDRAVGSALSLAEETGDGGLIVRSHLRLDHLPVDEIIPSWAQIFLGNVLAAHPTISLETAGRMRIDADGALRQFQSLVRVPGSRQQARLEGTIDAENKVTVSLTAGGIHYETVRHLPDGVSIGDELSPQATMPGLYPGRRWTVPIYSPLRPGHKPLEILHARVSGQETLHFDGQFVTADIVNYRSDIGDHHPPRSRIWVEPRGRVLRHESVILGSTLQFIRCPDDVAELMAVRLEDHDEQFRGFAWLEGLEPADRQPSAITPQTSPDQSAANQHRAGEAEPDSRRQPSALRSPDD